MIKINNTKDTANCIAKFTSSNENGTLYIHFETHLKEDSFLKLLVNDFNFYVWKNKEPELYKTVLNEIYNSLEKVKSDEEIMTYNGKLPLNIEIVHNIIGHKHIMWSNDY